MRHYYGFRFYSGRETTYGDSGRIAGELSVFKSKSERIDWLDSEDRTAPISCEGGERISVSRREAIALVGLEGFNESVEYSEID
jgi:hypothetical protein